MTEELYQSVKNSFYENRIQLCNIVGFGSYNYSSVMGNKSGFQAWGGFFG